MRITHHNNKSRRECVIFKILHLICDLLHFPRGVISFLLVMFEKIKIYFSVFHQLPPLFYYFCNDKNLLQFSRHHIIVYAAKKRKERKEFYSKINSLQLHTLYYTIIYHFDLSLVAIKLGNFVICL